MNVSLNAWMNDPPLLAAIRALGFTHLRGGLILDRLTGQLNQTTESQAAIVKAIAAAGFTMTSIVWSPDHINWCLGSNDEGVNNAALAYRKWLADILTIEVGNECNIGTNKQMTPSSYAEFANECIDRCAALGMQPPYIGCPHNINNADAMQWLADVVRRIIPFPTFMYKVALHSYVVDPQQFDWKKLTDTDMVRVRRIIGGRQFAITETGLWNAPRKEPKFSFLGLKCGTITRVWTEDYVAQWAREMLSYWQKQGADYVSWYQLNDADPAVDPAESFGIRRYNLSNPYDWKPVASALGGFQ